MKKKALLLRLTLLRRVFVYVLYKECYKDFVYVLRNGELREFLLDGLHFLCTVGGKCICTERSRDKKN